MPVAQIVHPNDVQKEVNIRLPEKLVLELQSVAEYRKVTVAELLMDFLRNK